MRRLFIALGVILLSISSQAFATTYYWTSGNGGSWSDIADACTGSLTAKYGSLTNGNGYTYYGFELDDPTSAECMGRDSRNVTVNMGGVSRVGDSCLSSATYNSSTGACDISADDGALCPDQTGARGTGDPMIYSSSKSSCVLMTDADNDALCHYMASAGSTASTYMVKGTIVNGVATAPPTFATDGFACELKTLTSSDCTINIHGSVTCQVTATYTGNVSSKVTEVVSDAKDVCVTGSTCVDTAPVTTHTDTGCVAAGNCTQDVSSDTTGSQKCGTVNGSLYCTDTNPTSTDTKTVQSTTSTTNADGSVTSSLNTDKTITSCSDVGSCTSSTSTTTTTTTTTTSGSTSSSTTCTGSCTSTGGSVGTGTSGDGGDDSNGTATTSDNCTSPPYCDGDAYSCAILKQEWIDSCAVRSLPTTDEQATWDAKVADSKALQTQAQSDLDEQVNGFVSTFESASSGSGGGKCFADQTVSVNGNSVVLPFSEVCDALQYFRFALLVAAYLISARLVSTEV